MKLLQIKTLKHGWQDRSEMILHAAFQCLVDFVEKELNLPARHLRPCTKTYAHEYYTVERLYNWWTKERPARVDPLSEVECPDDDDEDVSFFWDTTRQQEWKRACDLHYRYELICDAEDDRMLRELLEIRKWLWT